ncbi:MULTISPECIES: response regulator transcription factor [unclassified Corynebacterium]|nr:MULTISPECIES: response regulator transcription factor [unclassified Corynebacterium]
MLADDQPLLVSALKTILNSQEDMEVVATAHDGDQAISCAQRYNLDLAILDIRMPHCDGLSALREILALERGIKVLMLTTFNEPRDVETALRLGAHGFLLKDADPAELISGVRAVARGESVLSSGVTGTVLESWRAVLTQGELSSQARQGLNMLTPREVEVLKLIELGHTNPEIAEKLFISGATVKTHVSNLLAKLHCRDRVALVLLAQKARL